jgi:1,4-alpha-glucan branching enzyme
LRGQNINVYHVNNGDKVVAFHRWQDGGVGDDVVVVMNFANQSYLSYTIGFPRPGSWQVRFNSDWQGYSPDYGNQPGYNVVAGAGARDGMSYWGNFGIGPYTALILSQGA